MFFVELDLGQKRDFSALAVVERADARLSWMGPAPPLAVIPVHLALFCRHHRTYLGGMGTIGALSSNQRTTHATWDQLLSHGSTSPAVR
jgi:hypothetical protein